MKPPVTKGVVQDKTEKSKITADKPNEKPKASGKLEFFKAKPKESKDVKEEIKADDNKKQFFGAKKIANPPIKPPSPSLSVTSKSLDKEKPNVHFNICVILID